LSRAPHFLQAAHFVDNSFEDPFQRIRAERPVVVGRDVAKDVFLALRLVNWQIDRLLHFPDAFHHFGSPVQSLQQLAVDGVDVVAILRKKLERLFASHPSIPFRSDRANASRSPFSSIVRTNALPTTTPSASCATSRACSGVEIPNPTASGSSVYSRI